MKVFYGQGNEPVSSMLFGGNKVSNTGCGVISLYNSLKLLGRHRNLSDIIHEFDLNPSSKTTGLIQQLIFRKPDKYSLPWNGFLGASPAGISDFST